MKPHQVSSPRSKQSDTEYHAGRDLVIHPHHFAQSRRADDLTDERMIPEEAEGERAAQHRQGAVAPGPRCDVQAINARRINVVGVGHHDEKSHDEDREDERHPRLYQCLQVIHILICLQVFLICLQIFLICLQVFLICLQVFLICLQVFL